MWFARVVGTRDEHADVVVRAIRRSRAVVPVSNSTAASGAIPVVPRWPPELPVALVPAGSRWNMIDPPSAPVASLLPRCSCKRIAKSRAKLIGLLYQACPARGPSSGVSVTSPVPELTEALPINAYASAASWKQQRLGSPLQT